MLKKLFNWLKGLFYKEKPFKYKYLEDAPEKLIKNTIYIIGEKNFCWQLLMLCPCGCNNKIHLNLMEEESPCWSYSINKNHIINISPSVNRLVGCKSHFFIKKGEVVWA